MDLGNIPLNALIVGPTNSGKTQFLMNHLCGLFNSKFDYIVLICPTFAYNRTLYLFAERDPRLYVIICEQHHVEFWLKFASFCFEGTTTLIILDDCAASKDVKGRTGELVKLGFSGCHAGISEWDPAVCGPSSSLASQSLSVRTLQQSFFFTRHRPRERGPSSKNTRASFLMTNSSRWF